MSEFLDSDEPPVNPLWQFTKIVGTAVLVAAAILLVFAGRAPTGMNGIGPGEAMPAIEAAGWLNGPPPDLDRLKGSVVVVDEWASWCRPCRDKAPDLVKTHEKYREKGVVFLGLTRQGDAEEMEGVRRFVSELGISWPNGYGAQATLERFGAQGIPAIWVIGRDGRVVWNEDGGGELEEAIERALAAK